LPGDIYGFQRGVKDALVLIRFRRELRVNPPGGLGGGPVALRKIF
jgi:hypothetical protein